MDNSYPKWEEFEFYDPSKEFTKVPLYTSWKCGCVTRISNEEVMTSLAAPCSPPWGECCNEAYYTEPNTSAPSCPWCFAALFTERWTHGTQHFVLHEDGERDTLRCLIAQATGLAEAYQDLITGFERMKSVMYTDVEFRNNQPIVPHAGSGDQHNFVMGGMNAILASYNGVHVAMVTSAAKRWFHDKEALRESVLPRYCTEFRDVRTAATAHALATDNIALKECLERVANEANKAVRDLVKEAEEMQELRKEVEKWSDVLLGQMVIWDSYN